MSLFLSLFEKIPGLKQPFIGCIAGGILSGAPIALVLHAGGSTGGVDIAGVVINRLWPSWTIGKIIFWLNLFLIIISGILYGILQLLLTVLSMYIASKSLDVCYEYVKHRKLIIPSKDNMLNN